jgi:glycerol-3-phosphate dehydrogenase
MFRDLNLSRDDIDLHYSGVRPLPFSGGATPASVTRRHWMEEHHDAPVPMYSIIGGKLTTCRSLAESSAATILTRIGMPHLRDSGQRTIPGGENYPANETGVLEQCRRLANQWSWTEKQVRALWELCGTRTALILEQLADRMPENLPGTEIPCSFARFVIRHEWVTTLGDLVERRLMLLYDPHLSTACLRRLAELLCAEGRLASGDIDQAVTTEVERLHTHFGKRLE